MGRLAQIVVGVLLSSLCAARSARALELELHWEAPRDCPSAEALRLAIERRVGAELRLRPGATVRVVAAVRSEAGGYRLELESVSASGPQRRELKAPSCNELARATVLIAALLFVEPGPAPPGLERAGEPRRSRTAASLIAHAQLVADLGSLPAVSFGPAAGLGLALSNTELELGVLYLPRQEVKVAGQLQSVAALQLFAARAGVCQRWSLGPAFGTCLHAEFGRLSGRGQNVRAARSGGVTWLYAALGVRLAVDLDSSLRWQAELSAGLPWDDATFSIRDVGTVHQVSRVVGRFETGVAAEF